MDLRIFPVVAVGRLAYEGEEPASESGRYNGEKPQAQKTSLSCMDCGKEKFCR